MGLLQFTLFNVKYMKKKIKELMIIKHKSIILFW
jgi:hypothetical protein